MVGMAKSLPAGQHINATHGIEQIRLAETQIISIIIYTKLKWPSDKEDNLSKCPPDA